MIRSSIKWEGSKVRSRFRAPWYGIILNIDEHEIATVQVLFDRHCNKMQKPMKKELHLHWLTILGSKQQPSTRETRFIPVPDFMKEDHHGSDSQPH
jgi:hypothetical protein